MEAKPDVYRHFDKCVDCVEWLARVIRVARPDFLRMTMTSSPSSSVPSLRLPVSFRVRQFSSQKIRILAQHISGPPPVVEASPGGGVRGVPRAGRSSAGGWGPGFWTFSAIVIESSALRKLERCFHYYSRCEHRNGHIERWGSIITDFRERRISAYI